MLKGHVFSKQIFGNPIFALFINTFTGGKNGVSNDYGNGMAVTYSGNTVTVDNGAICIQGRFLEEDTSTDISAGTDNMFCKLVIEIDLDKQNTESDFQQGAYRIIKSASAYPELTQADIVKNNSGIYQYELARFKTTSSGITDFQDQRTFLDFDSIYAKIQNDYESILNQLKQELANVQDGSSYKFKNEFAVLTGTIEPDGTSLLSKVIDYPEGFDKENCVVIASMLQNGNSANRAWSEGTTFDTSGYITGSLPHRTCLGVNNITINAKNINISSDGSVMVPNIEISYNFKIVLMRI